jgi:hypothetical protein
MRRLSAMPAQRRRKQQGRRREPEMDSERMGETVAVSYASGTTNR